jgi:hypothetical protein
MQSVTTELAACVTADMAAYPRDAKVWQQNWLLDRSVVPEIAAWSMDAKV